MTYHGNGKSGWRWKLIMAVLWVRHPLWCWKVRKQNKPKSAPVPPHTFGDGK